MRLDSERELQKILSTSLVCVFKGVNCSITNSTTEALTGDWCSYFPWKKWAEYLYQKQVKMVGYPLSTVPHLPGDKFLAQRLKKEHWNALWVAMTKFSGSFGIIRWSEGMSFP